MKTAIDPFARTVLLPEKFREEGEREPSSFIMANDMQLVVEAPSCMIAMPGQTIFYIGSIAWNYTLLVEVVWQEGTWLAVRSQKNPLPAHLEPLIRDGLVIPGRSIDQGL